MILTFPDRQIKARAQVTRSRDLEGSSCVAGLQFLGMAASDTRYIEAYVAGQANRRR